MNDAVTVRSRASMERDDWLFMGGLLLILFATRIAWILSNPDATQYWEEDYRWVAAREILAGLQQPVFDYQADNYQGGSLVLIGIITGLFALFGESLLSLKLAPLGFAAATLAAIYILGRLWFGRRTALIAASAYLAGPPLLLHSALIPMGSHGESALFSLVQFICFLGILSRRWHTPLGWAALGFVSGLGLWFCYTSGLSLVACGMTWLILEGIPRLRLLLAATGGALLGLIPWFAYNLQNDFTGFLRLFEIFGAGDPIDAWVAQGPLEKFLGLVLRDLPIGMLDPFRDLSHVGVQRRAGEEGLMDFGDGLRFGAPGSETETSQLAGVLVVIEAPWVVRIAGAIQRHGQHDDAELARVLRYHHVQILFHVAA